MVHTGYARANEQGLLIHCDYTCRVLRVATDAPIMMGHRSMFRHVAQYHSWSAWRTSPYFAQVTDEDAQDNIMWFWHDMDMHAIPGEE